MTVPDNKQINDASHVSMVLIMAFVIVVLVMIIEYISNAVYIQTVSYPLVFMILLLLFVLSKAVLMPYHKLLYPAILGLGLLLGGWFLNESVVSSAKNGAIILAVVMVIDAFYVGYVYRSLMSTKVDTTFKYATYGSVLSAIVLALAFGYVAI